MDQEGVPIVGGFGIEQIAALPRAPWGRLGGQGSLIDLNGMEGVTGAYVIEVPAGGSLRPERHLYDELMYAVSGRGSLEAWTDPARKVTLEWSEGSLFSPPLNAWHQLYNGTDAPAVLFAVTTAPLALDLYRSPDFVFGNDHVFSDRFTADPDFYTRSVEKQTDLGWVYWETNHLPDAPNARIAPREQKGAGVKITVYEMAGNVLVGHIADWPAGRYHKAHYHGGGAVLLILRSRGYTLLWPRDAGPRPFEAGHADRVVRVEWRKGSILCPPSGWFHQHFNTGGEPARQLALRLGSKKYGVRFYDVQDAQGINVSIRDGGSLIEYADEDPEIGNIFRRELAAQGVRYEMPDTVSAGTVAT